MGKITPGVTPEDEFRRVINEAGGNVQINTTPANLLKALKDIGGNVSYDSGDTAIVPAVNEGGAYPEGDVDYSLCYLDIFYTGRDEYLTADTYPIIPIAPFCGIKISDINKISVNRDATTVINMFKAQLKSNVIKVVMNGITIPEDKIYLFTTPSLSIAFRKCDEIDNVISNNGGSLLGVSMHIVIKEGTLHCSSGYNNTIDYTFNYGDDVLYNTSFPDDADTICGVVPNCDIGKTSSYASGLAGVTGYEEGTSIKSSPHYSFIKDVIEAFDNSNNIRVGIYTIYYGWSVYDMYVTHSGEDSKYHLNSVNNDPLFSGNKKLSIVLCNIKPVYNDNEITDIVLDYPNPKDTMLVRVTHIS